MIDSVLKGTGNSRFLKSAVPAGTSWADALAMLQAGTFPIDFNGINTEGFQQVGTPLNKANLLKDATAAQIGLPPSTTPDGMFQALGNTGELHVWRKTVVTKEPIPEVPGSYTLGTAQRLYVATRTFANSSYESYVEGVLASNAITIDLDGKVTLTDPAEVTLYIYNRRDGVTSQTGREAISGYSYFLIPSTSASFIGCEISMTKDEIYYIPATSNYYRTSSSSGGQSSFDAAQLVTGVPGTPAIPAGTTTTYPVSTNPNAYQEGDDAKEAGYTLGEVVTGKFRMGDLAPSNAYEYEYADGVTVDENGTVSLQNPSGFSINSESHQGYESTISPLISGKFLRYKGRNSSYGGSDAPDTQHPFDATPSVIIYIPADVVVTSTDIWPAGFYLDKYQPVTGYAAIPAGTTIEYLGKLGDKARVQVVSYVGTGTYGSGKETKIPVDFPPELLIIALKDITRRTVYISVPRSGTGLYLSADGSSSIYGEMAATVSYVDGKVHILCSDSFGQMNASGYTYIAVALG